MEEAGREVKMSQVGGERREVGLTSEEVRELNTPKPKRDMTRTHLVKKAVNVLAAGLTAAAGVWLAGTLQNKHRHFNHL